MLARFGSTLLARISNTDLRSSSPSRRLWHLGDAPVAVLAVDVGLSIDQHAVGQFEHQDLRIVQSPTGQVVAEFEPARLVTSRVRSLTRNTRRTWSSTSSSSSTQTRFE